MELNLQLKNKNIWTSSAIFKTLSTSSTTRKLIPIEDLNTPQNIKYAFNGIHNSSR